MREHACPVTWIPDGVQPGSAPAARRDHAGRPKSLYAEVLAYLGGRHTARCVRGIGVVTHPMRLLMAALCTHEYLNIEFKGRPVWHKLFEA